MPSLWHWVVTTNLSNPSIWCLPWSTRMAVPFVRCWPWPGWISMPCARAWVKSSIACPASAVWKGMCNCPMASAGCSMSVTSWPSSARISSSRPNSLCWRPSTRRGPSASCCAPRGWPRRNWKPPSTRCAVARRWTTPTPRRIARRWRSTPSTSPSGPRSASSTRWSAVMTKFAAPFRCCSAAPRTTPCWSAPPASARPPSSRGWPSASSTARCRRGSRTSGCSPWTWGPWWPVPSTAVSSRSGSRRCWTIWLRRRATSSSSSTSCTPWSVPARARGPWTRATCWNRRWRGANCTASGPPRSMNIASSSRRMPRWSAASRRCWWKSRAWRIPSPSCAAWRSVTSCTTTCRSPTPPSWRRPSCRTATSRIASCRTRPSTSSTRRRPASGCRSTPNPSLSIGSSGASSSWNSSSRRWWRRTTTPAASGWSSSIRRWRKRIGNTTSWKRCGRPRRPPSPAPSTSRRRWSRPVRISTWLAAQGTWAACPSCSTVASPSWRNSSISPPRRRCRRPACCATGSPTWRSQTCWRAGPAFRSPACWKGSGRSCCGWKISCIAGWSARRRRWTPSPTPSAAPAPGCLTRTVPSAPSCSSAPPGWARPSCARRWPSSCSIPRMPWCGSTCRSSWRNTAWPVW